MPVGLLASSFPRFVWFGPQLQPRAIHDCVGNTMPLSSQHLVPRFQSRSEERVRAGDLLGLGAANLEDLSLLVLSRKDCKSMRGDVAARRDAKAAPAALGLLVRHALRSTSTVPSGVHQRASSAPMAFSTQYTRDSFSMIQ